MTHHPATAEELRAAFDASTWRGRVPFGAACLRPSTRAVLELGAAINRRPPRPLDHKQKQSGETDD